MAKATQPVPADHPRAIGRRLRLLRIAFGNVQGATKELGQSEFARSCGVGISALNNAELGVQRLGLDNANRIRARTGAPLDFIYHDNRNGLPRAIDAEIARLEKIEIREAS
jgi:transcriptional regulator with XRE-family HTH domain